MNQIYKLTLIAIVLCGCETVRPFSRSHDTNNTSENRRSNDSHGPFATEVVQTSHEQVDEATNIERLAQTLTPLPGGDQPLIQLDELAETPLDKSTSPDWLRPELPTSRDELPIDNASASLRSETDQEPATTLSGEATSVEEQSPGVSNTTLPTTPNASQTEATQVADVNLDPNAFPIDFRNALAIAVGQNPQVSFAAARVREAYAQHHGARALWLPSFSMGASIYNHQGQLQNAVGDVFDIDRGALYAGLGTRATGTSTPKVPGLATQFALADALYQPVVARQRHLARIHDANATTNDVMLSTALAYLELLNAHQLKSVSDQTKEMASDLLSLTSSFAKAGQGPQSDADRAAAELTSRRYKVVRTIESIDVATARLAHQLALDANAKLMPVEAELIPIKLVDETETLTAHVEAGLRSRRELLSSRHLVEAACAQLRKERASVLLPSFGFSASYGGFGGGQNSDYGRNFDERIDFEGYAYWKLRNLGFGEQAARQAAGARLDQTRSQQIQLINQITREIREAYARTQSRNRSIEITREGIESARHAYERDVNRIRHGEGLPIEALTSLRALDSARRDYANAILEHNQAQFELLHATGWPGGQSATDFSLGGSM